jgi:hypothetical protein
MTELGKKLRIIELQKLLGIDEVLKRLEGVEGLERSLVAQAAQRAERQGGVEDLREGSAVAPGEAEAALRGLRIKLLELASEARNNRIEALEANGPMMAEYSLGEWNAYTLAAREVVALLPKPDSGADALSATEAMEPSPEPTREP